MESCSLGWESVMRCVRRHGTNGGGWVWALCGDARGGLGAWGAIRYAWGPGRVVRRISLAGGRRGRLRIKLGGRIGVWGSEKPLERHGRRTYWIYHTKVTNIGLPATAFVGSQMEHLYFLRLVEDLRVPVEPSSVLGRRVQSLEDVLACTDGSILWLLSVL